MAVPYAADAVFEYDASDASTLTIVDGKVSAWADRVNSYDLAQTNASQRPTVTVVDGVTCLNTSNGYLNGSSLPLTGDATIFAKVYGNGYVSGSLNGMWFKADTQGQCAFGGLLSQAPNWYESFGGAGTGFANRPLLPTNVSAVAQNVWTTATIRRSGNTIYGGFDGVEGAGAASTAGGWTAAYTIPQITSGWFFKGYVSYLLLYDRSLTTAEMATVNAYIAGSRKATVSPRRRLQQRRRLVV